jgi:hypothetical protein
MTTTDSGEHGASTSLSITPLSPVAPPLLPPPPPGVAAAPCLLWLLGGGSRPLAARSAHVLIFPFLVAVARARDDNNRFEHGAPGAVAAARARCGSGGFEDGTPRGGDSIQRSGLSATVVAS